MPTQPSAKEEARIAALAEKVSEVKNDEPCSDASAEEVKTEVGNYFVSNYPPFSFWSPAYNAEAEKLLDTEAPADLPLGLYFHIPFCRKRCHFCYFRVYTDKKADEIREYVDASMAEFAAYAARPYLQGRKPKYIYFGGGTPSYLSSDQLKDLTGRMKDLMPWDEVEEVAFECEPGTLTEKKVNAIRELGVTRLSLGVENFDSHILELNGRAHKGPEIERAYQWAKAAGFEQINIDLIAGMIDETEENWKLCVEKAIEMDPEMMTIYQMEVPYNTTMYQQMKEQGKFSAPVADWETKRRWVSEAYARLAEAGYEVTSAYTVAKNPDKMKFVYRDALWAGSDLLPIGVASFGHLGGIHLQNEHNIEPYVAKVKDGGATGLYRSYVTDPEERFIREFILTMKLGRLDLGYYRKKFGVEPREIFATQFQELLADGWATLDGDDFRLTEKGLLQVDRLLHGFFLERHRNARYA